MFGYVTVNEPELKIREYARYRAFYCGLCQILGERHGLSGRLTLTYDMTFLIILLTSVYEPHTREQKKRCVVHPTKKHDILCNEITEYAADMNLLLVHDHLEDDWHDEKKFVGLLGMNWFRRKKKEISLAYPRQAHRIGEALRELSERERQDCRDLDAVSRPFGELMGELFVYREDAFEGILRSFGFYLGKYIYLLDAYLDIEKDKKNHCFNPFLEMSEQKTFDERVGMILDGTLRMAVAEFEKLPCEQDLAILRNILYEGIRKQIVIDANERLGK